MAKVKLRAFGVTYVRKFLGLTHVRGSRPIPVENKELPNGSYSKFNSAFFSEKSIGESSNLFAITSGEVMAKVKLRAFGVTSVRKFLGLTPVRGSRPLRVEKKELPNGSYSKFNAVFFRKNRLEKAQIFLQLPLER